MSDAEDEGNVEGDDEKEDEFTDRNVFRRFLNDFDDLIFPHITLDASSR